MRYYLSGQKGVDKYYVRYIEITNETVNSSYFLCSLVTGRNLQEQSVKIENAILFSVFVASTSGLDRPD